MGGEPKQGRRLCDLIHREKVAGAPDTSHGGSRCTRTITCFVFLFPFSSNARFGELPVGRRRSNNANKVQFLQLKLYCSATRPWRSSPRVNKSLSIVCFCRLFLSSLFSPAAAAAALGNALCSA